MQVGVQVSCWSSQSLSIKSLAKGIFKENKQPSSTTKAPCLFNWIRESSRELEQAVGDASGEVLQGLDWDPYFATGPK